MIPPSFQGAYLLVYPENVSTIFWSSVPAPYAWPMLISATLAAIVASQALISGSFSIIRQAMTLGVFPKLKVQTSSLRMNESLGPPL